MRALLLKLFKGRIVSPWWIFMIDMGIVANVFIVIYLLRINVYLPDYSLSSISFSGFVVLACYGFVFLATGSYRGVVRHSNYQDFKMMLRVSFLAFTFLFIGNELLIYFNVEWLQISRFLLIFHFLLTALLTITFRMFVKEVYVFLTPKKTTTDVLIFGAGEMGQITYEAICNDKDNRYNVIGFVDDAVRKQSILLHGRPVMSWSRAMDLCERKNVQEMILAVNHISVQRKHQITMACLDKGCKLKVMPSVRNWVNGVSNQQQIRDIRIEDILGREEITLNQRRITDGLSGKTIMVTGAAGSIGSEIVRQLLRFPVRKVVMVDMAESALYDLQQELLLGHEDHPFEAVLADVTNHRRMEELFIQYAPQIIFNAAAYKHVPLMEAYPYEAVRVNIGGLKNLADLALKYQVDKFVMVSTDKAVNPTNVMGASKRACEIYVQALAQRNDIKTAFITTRFGNVLGSNGSVVPLFKKQIQNGGPVTVTHKDIVRYFMTIPEACQLVLEAGFMGAGGEIFVFDMGDPVKIVDLAKEMIRLSGLKVDEDINIAYTGLRPGEKLYEELLASKENTLPSHHDKIMIGKTLLFDYDEVNGQVEELLLALQSETDVDLVLRLKKLVPEYLSQNSKYTEVEVQGRIVPVPIEMISFR
ncbi:MULTISPECIES: polysaccharide biosynthesis protein [unclassified Carboxylicivirga]|uniref:polysaccharide biosynthesis protein n=1 Tax=Carboxylicivirga TaxID=1628153 RepID=UPI003D352875